VWYHLNINDHHTATFVDANEQRSTVFRVLVLLVHWRQETHLALHILTIGFAWKPSSDLNSVSELGTVFTASWLATYKAPVLIYQQIFLSHTNSGLKTCTDFNHYEFVISTPTKSSLVSTHDARKIVSTRKATIGCHVCPSAWNSSPPTGWIFMEFDMTILRKSFEKIQASLKSNKYNGQFTWRPVYMYGSNSLNSS
jgi:hypothetical protein